jgi:hypothetical protein
MTGHLVHQLTPTTRSPIAATDDAMVGGARPMILVPDRPTINAERSEAHITLPTT